MDIESTSALVTSKQIITYLSNQFPNCFTITGETKPLKIGIFQDIAERLATEDERFSKTKLRLALRLYTANWKYLYSIKAGANRVDLDGNTCEVVTDEQAMHALAQLKESKAKAKAKTTEKSANGKIANGSRDEGVIRVPASRNNIPKNKRNDEKVKHSVKSREVKKSPKKIDVTQLQIGLSVMVRIGTKSVQATIINIEKDHVKVKVPSGMELTVTTEYILIQ